MARVFKETIELPRGVDLDLLSHVEQWGRAQFPGSIVSTTIHEETGGTLRSESVDAIRNAARCPIISASVILRTVADGQFDAAMSDGSKGTVTLTGADERSVLGKSELFRRDFQASPSAVRVEGPFTFVIPATPAKLPIPAKPPPPAPLARKVWQVANMNLPAAIIGALMALALLGLGGWLMSRF